MTHEECRCQNCDGTGEVECECCGGNTACDECDGSGLDADRIDVAAFSKAHDELLRDSHCTWGLRGDEGKVIGRCNDHGKIRYGDFAKEAST